MTETPSRSQTVGFELSAFVLGFVFVARGLHLAVVLADGEGPLVPLSFVALGVVLIYAARPTVRHVATGENGGTAVGRHAGVAYLAWCVVVCPLLGLLVTYATAGAGGAMLFVLVFIGVPAWLAYAAGNALGRTRSDIVTGSIVAGGLSLVIGALVVWDVASQMQ